MDTDKIKEAHASLKAEEIYQSLYEAVKAAAISEAKVEDYRKMHVASGLSKRMDELQTGELPERMGKLISALDLFNSFQSLGRYIRRFTDAEHVLHNLRQQVVTKLREKNLESCPAIQPFIDCCNTMQELVLQALK